MKTGFNLLLWTTHVGDAELHLLDTLKRTGYDGVEVPVFEGDEAHYVRLGTRLEDLGLGCTTVTVIPDVVHSPISPEKRERAAALDYLKWAIDCNAALGSEALVGPWHSPLAVFSGHGPTADEKARCAEVHRAAADYAAERGVRLAVEYLNRFECYFLTTMADAVAHCRAVGHPNLGTMYDTFHANIEEKDPIGAIAQAGSYLRHVHISENDRGTPGKGHIDWPSTFRALKAAGWDGWLTIEAFGRSLPAVAAATKVWRDFFPTKEEVYIEGLRFMKEQWAAA